MVAAETAEFAELSVQPDSQYFNDIDELKSNNGVVAVGVDPTRGSLTALLVQLPGMWERIMQGKLVGYHYTHRDSRSYTCNLSLR